MLILVGFIIIVFLFNLIKSYDQKYWQSAD